MNLRKCSLVVAGALVIGAFGVGVSSVSASCSNGIATSIDTQPVATTRLWAQLPSATCTDLKHMFWTMNIGSGVAVYADNSVSNAAYGPTNMNALACQTSGADSILANAAGTNDAWQNGWEGGGLSGTTCPCGLTAGNPDPTKCPGTTVWLETNEKAATTAPLRFQLAELPYNAASTAYDGDAQLSKFNCFGGGACTTALATNNHIITTVFTPTFGTTSLAGTTATVVINPVPTIGPTAGPYMVKNYLIYQILDNNAAHTYDLNNFNLAAGWSLRATYPASSCTSSPCPSTTVTLDLTGYTQATQEIFLGIGLEFFGNTAMGAGASYVTSKVGSVSAPMHPTSGPVGSFTATTAVYNSLQSVTIGFSTTDETGVTGFNIYRGAGLSPSTWTKLTTTPMAANGVPSTYSYTDDTIPRQRTYQTYTYKFDAIDAAGNVLYNIQVKVSK